MSLKFSMSLYPNPDPEVTMVLSLLLIVPLFYFGVFFTIYQCIPNNNLFNFAFYLDANWIILYVFFMTCSFPLNMMVHMVVVHSLLLWYNTLLHEWTTIYLSILVLMDFALIPDFAVTNHGTIIIVSMVPDIPVWVL